MCLNNNFQFFWKYVWVKKFVKICVMLFKNWKHVFKLMYQRDLEYRVLEKSFITFFYTFFFLIWCWYGKLWEFQRFWLYIYIYIYIFLYRLRIKCLLGVTKNSISSSLNISIFPSIKSLKLCTYISLSNFRILKILNSALHESWETLKTTKPTF